MMTALGTSQLKLFACRGGGMEEEDVLLCSRNVGVYLGFPRRVRCAALLIRCKKLDDRSVSLPPSSSPQIVHDNEETQMILYSDHQQIKSVHVRFKLQRQCAFGQQFILVGDDPILGLWNPCGGVPLNWSDDHIWTLEMDIPTGKVIKYKFILMSGPQIISWQPGPDRILEITDTGKTIVVSEHWDDPQLQIVFEEEPSMPSSSAAVSNVVVPENGKSDDSEEIIGTNGHASSSSFTDDPPAAATTNKFILLDNGVSVFVPESASLSSSTSGVEVMMDSAADGEDDAGVEMVLVRRQGNEKKTLEVDVEWCRKAVLKFLANFWDFE